MRTSTISNTATADTYWDTLKNLDADVKLDLIGRLAASLRKKEVASPSARHADKYYGAWQDDKTAEELADEIRANRHTGTRELTSFDD